MSVVFEDECCGCATESYPCMGSACKNRNVPHFYCDNCGDECEPEELYVFDADDAWLCKTCVCERFKTVAEDIDAGHIDLDEWG